MSLFPYAGAHAVQSAAFALEWPEPLPEAEIATFGATHEQLKASLPNMQQMQSVVIEMNPTGLTSGATGLTSGFIFSKVGASGIDKALEIQRNRLIGQINNYTRWNPVWAEVKNWFSAVAPKYGQRQISVVGLQYTDVFHWRDAPAKLNLREVFREASSFLPKHIFELKGLWHAHHGYFVDKTEPLPHRLLENINVNLVEELGQRSIVITTVHKAEIKNIWGWDNLEDKIEPIMSNLHLQNKTILGDLLTDDVKRLIKLNGGDTHA